jgi:Ni/Co efflux regulator RcnB
MEHRRTSRLGIAILLTASALVGTSLMAAPTNPDRGPAHAAPSQFSRQARPAPPPHTRPAPPPRRAERRQAPRPHFDQRFRGVVHDYYMRSYASEHCPPGLNRRGASCVRNGMRSWSRGKSLPRQVVYYDLPARLLVQLPVAPSGHRYVRVGGDVLMLAVGTGIVVDALMDIFD